MAIEITMPRLSDTMETGTIISWNVKEGDAVASGDVVADVETDKATMEMQVFDDGTLAKILIPEGQSVDVGTLIAIVAEDDESAEDAIASVGAGSAPSAATAGGSATAVIDAPPVATTDTATSTATPRSGNGRIRVSPVARQLADDHGIDLNGLQGSGPSGRIIKRDVLSAVEAGSETVASIAPSAAPVAVTVPVVAPSSVAQPIMPVAQPFVGTAGSGLQDQLVPLSNMRQTIARRLVESKTTIPHYQVTVTFEMESILELRSSLNEQLAAQGVKLSVNDFLVRACALAMHEHPDFNASWAETGIQYHGRVNIGVAVALPAERGGGLVVASITDADQKSLRSISLETKQLARKARERGLTPDEMSGSTFTLSNLGMFGVDNFTAIINPPNAAILAVGAALEKPVVRNGELVVGREMSATLSLDHRVIDGAMAARYLQSLKGMIEMPATLLV